MNELVDGVTRYPRTRAVFPEKYGWAAAVVPGAFAIGLTVAAVLSGAEVAPLVLTALLAVVVPPATVLVPWRWLRYLVIVLVALLLFSLADSTGEGEPGLIGLMVLTATIAGFLLLSGADFRQWWRQRLASAEGAPPSRLDPRGGKDVGILAWWLDERYEYEMTTPAESVVLGAVRGLDGVERSVVSIYHGKGRMDIGGDANGLMVVQQSDSRKQWYQLFDRAAGFGGRGRVSVTLAGDVLTMPRERFVVREDAERAVLTWLRRGVRDDSLPWGKHSDAEAESTRRPGMLRRTS